MSAFLKAMLAESVIIVSIWLILQVPVAVRKFESEEASIQDLPGEYQEFLDNRENYSEEDQRYFDGYIRKWRERNCFVLEFYENYWMSADGEVESS